MNGAVLEGLIGFRLQRWPGRSWRMYRAGSVAWKRDHIPNQVHLGVPGGKSSLSGCPRRWLEITDTDVVEQTDRHFGGRLPLCARCQSVANGEAQAG